MTKNEAKIIARELKNSDDYFKSKNIHKIISLLKSDEITYVDGKYTISEIAKNKLEEPKKPKIKRKPSKPSDKNKQRNFEDLSYSEKEELKAEIAKITGEVPKSALEVIIDPNDTIDNYNYDKSSIQYKDNKKIENALKKLSEMDRAKFLLMHNLIEIDNPLFAKYFPNFINNMM